MNNHVLLDIAHRLACSEEKHLVDAAHSIMQHLRKDVLDESEDGDGSQEEWSVGGWDVLGNDTTIDLTMFKEYAKDMHPWDVAIELRDTFGCTFMEALKFVRKHKNGSRHDD